MKIFPISQDNKIDIQHKKYEIFDLSLQISLLSLPTFDLISEEKVSLDAIIRILPKFRQKKSIVFDIRGNTGGNSALGKLILEALFGQDYVNYCFYKLNQGVRINWKISEGNIKHVTYLSRKIKNQFDLNSNERQWIKKIYNGMIKAQKEKKHFFHETLQETMNLVQNKTTPSYCNAQIVILIDKFCVSAALDFIELVKVVLPNVILIGTKTGYDSVYMEVRDVLLASKIACLSFPIKAYKGRLRKNNEPYCPDILDNNISYSNLKNISFY